MSWLAKVIYILFYLSMFIPIYTYAIYPLILLSFRKRQYESDDAFLPRVSVLIVAGKDEYLTGDKLESLRNLDYPNFEILTCEKITSEGVTVVESVQTQKTNILNCLLTAAQGEIVLFTDNSTPIDPQAIRCFVKHFADKRVGCVVGQLRSDNPSVFWKYENFVRQQEGKIGSVSGANKAIYAVREELVDTIPVNIINVDFYVSTLVQQKGYDVLFESKAIAYEQHDEQADHIHDGAGYYQAFKVFWRMYLPFQKGHFVYLSHRVFKCLVPFCLIILFGTSLCLSASGCFVGIVLLDIQVLGYISIILYYLLLIRRNIGNIRILSLAFYFICLNLSLLKGFFMVHEYERRAETDGKE